MRSRLMDLLFPPRCVLCRHGLTGKGPLCPDCAADIRQSYRAQGARPVEGCKDTDAALLYRGKVRRALVACKFQDKPTLGAWGGGMVAACLLRHQPDWKPDLVTFVPQRSGIGGSAALTCRVCWRERRRSGAACPVCRL